MHVVLEHHLLANNAGFDVGQFVADSLEEVAEYLVDGASTAAGREL